MGTPWTNTFTSGRLPGIASLDRHLRCGRDYSQVRGLFRTLDLWQRRTTGSTRAGHGRRPLSRCTADRWPTYCAGSNTNATGPGMRGSHGCSPSAIRSGTGTSSSASDPDRSGHWNIPAPTSACHAARSAKTARSGPGPAPAYPVLLAAGGASVQSLSAFGSWSLARR